jgi:MOSC domain-containing protein YiiM
MVHNGRAGWYYRVLQPGLIGPGNAVTLHERPNPDFRFDRLVSIVNYQDPTPDELARLAVMPGLATKLQEAARRHLKAVQPL